MSTITFAINNQRYDVDPSKYDLTLTLNGFIRRHTPFKGTKLSCGEGGCGACVVDIARPQSTDGSHSTKDSTIIHASVNSCIRPLASMDGWSVTTTEGLRKGQDFHPIQQRIADFNGSQCGFCTPGMVMTLYSSLQEKPNSTMAELEARYDGNICRCTGFRPILDAVKSFATDSNTANQVNRLPFARGPYDHEQFDPAFPSFLHTVDTTRRLEFKDANGRTWTRPANLTEAIQLAVQIGDNSSIKYVNANTSIGYVKSEPRTVRHFIDISNLSELHQIGTNENGITIGGATTVTNFIKLLRSQAASQPADKTRSFIPLADHAYRVASVHVRNVGTVAGNIILAKNYGFTSDLAVILLGANATVTWASFKDNKLSQETETMEQFLAKPQEDGEHRIIQAISVPWTNKNTFFRTYKAAPRPQQALAHIHAAFNVEVDESGLVVGQPVVAYGAVMGMDEVGSHPVRAQAAEAALKGKNLKERATLDAAISAVNQDFASSVGGGSGGGGEDTRHIARYGPGGEASRKYRGRVAAGFLYKYLIALSTSLHNESNLKLERSLSAVEDPAQRGVTTSSQIFQEVVSADEKKETPVHKAVPHIAARLQAAGDAIYTDDVKEVKGTLFGRFITAEKARVKLGSLDATEALKLPGVVGIVTAGDIQGFNNVTAFPPGVCALLVEQNQEISYVSQPLGVLIAETEKIAREGVRRVKINYKEDGEAKKPVTTIPEALKNISDYGVDKVREQMKMGDAEAILKQARDNTLPEGSHFLKGNIDIGTQHHFYMETQCAYVIPDEDKSIKVYAPVQWPDGANLVIAQILGVPLGKVHVINRRLGGGFGGKSFHPIVVAACSAIAALKFSKPVRMALDREEDFAIFGAREETYGDYEVVCDKEGRINAVKFAGWLNAGYTEGFAAFTCKAVLGSISEGYDLSNFDGFMSMVKTNTHPRTPCRAPGETQASYIMENIIDHVAHATGVAPDVVRERNFYTSKSQAGVTGVLQNVGLVDYKAPNGTPIENYSIPDLWARAKEKSGYEERRAAVDKFNNENRWKKRGLQLVTVRYEVTQLPRTALLNIYGDGSIILTHGGTEMGQGLHTKAAQAAAGTLLQVFDNPTPELSSEILRNVKIGDTDSVVIPNAIFTGGSTGSEGTAEAAKLAADEMSKRLRPIFEGILKKRSEAGDKNTSVSWKELAGAAKSASVNLQVSAYYDAGGKFNIMGGLHYHNFGVAACEVEVDVITGEVSVRSMRPYSPGG
eukprot:TRINITY_DN4059_c0_g1_i2.p1 TRINITY_DN4059_c0_g1~~TRINITY_DN4059_c0_g1_i2.p1  ORF type:complete len:1245 (-),score=352.66 TRINITY_DN4059_c0_g1_i2:104-3838(-)